MTGSVMGAAGLTVIYDDRCEFCRRCRRWLEEQAQLVPLRFLAAGDPGVRAWAGERLPVGAELVVADAAGATWIGPDAFIVCLWALRDHRQLAERLQGRGMSKLAKPLFHALSSGRGVVSAVLSDSDCGPESCSS